MALCSASWHTLPRSKRPRRIALAFFIVASARVSGMSGPLTAEPSGAAAPHVLANDDACNVTSIGLRHSCCSLSALQQSASGKLGRAIAAVSELVSSSDGLVSSSAELVSSSSLTKWRPMDMVLEAAQSIGEAAKNLNPLYRLGKDEPDRECHMGPSESCPLAEMSQRLAVAVSPGGQTACMNSTHDYKFEVIPGNLDKLLLFFGGGGACWDEWSTLVDVHWWKNPGLCFYKPVYSWLERELIDVRFKDYTIVNVLYCSGDIFVGNVTRPYKLDGVNVRQFGYHNTKAAVDWARANLAPRLSSLVLIGASAGALGVLAWSHRVLLDFSYERASIVLDSFAGFFPEGTQHPILSGWGLCGVDLLADSLVSQCNDDKKGITVEDFYTSVMSEFPDVAFAHINSKQDKIQMFFYDMMSYEYGKKSWLPLLRYSTEYTSFLNRMLARFESNPKYASFLMECSTCLMHCYTCFPMTQSLNKDFQVRGPRGVCDGRGRASELTLGDCLLRFIDRPVPTGTPSA